MYVLIIEDDSQKADSISTLIKSMFHGVDIEISRSYQSGVRDATKSNFDLIILDMSLPTFDPGPNVRQGRPRPLGGFDIMRKIRRKGGKTPIVVVTALENFGSPTEPITFQEMSSRCRAEFPEMFRTAIYYSQSKQGWQDELKQILGSFRD